MLPLKKRFTKLLLLDLSLKVFFKIDLNSMNFLIFASEKDKGGWDLKRCLSNTTSANQKTKKILQKYRTSVIYGIQKHSPIRL